MFRSLFRQRCHICSQYKLWKCQCGWLLGLSAAAWAFIAAATSAATTAGFAAYQSYSQAQQQQNVARAERSIREQEAESIRQSAAYDERQFRRRASFLLGEQSALIAASGVDPSRGSPLLFELDSARQVELEALNIRQKGAVGSQVQEYEARLARWRALYYGGQKVAGPVAAGVEGAAREVSILSSLYAGGGSGSRTRNLGTRGSSSISYSDILRSS